MNRKHILTAACLMSTITLAVTSCGGGGSSEAESEAIFPREIQVMDSKTIFTTDSAGRVTRLATTEGDYESLVEFEYGNFREDGNYQARMTWTDNEEPGTRSEIYLMLDDDGCAVYARDTRNTRDEWWMEYNDDNRLEYVRHTGSENSETRITYADGDLSAVTVRDMDGGVESSFTFTYTDGDHDTPMANMMAMMPPMVVLPVYPGDLEPAFNAGLLGKPSRNLPLRRVYTGADDQGLTDYMAWTLDDTGFPTRVVISDPTLTGVNSMAITFVR